MKKILSLFLTILLILAGTVFPVYAQSTENLNDSKLVAINDLEVELDMEELELGGVSVVIEKDCNGTYIARQVTEKELNFITNNLYKSSSSKVDATFHVGITYTASTRAAHLHWRATGKQLTQVSATGVCKSTSILNPTTYYEKSFVGYNDLNGRFNSAEGAGDTFYIPEGTTKVRVGWTNAYVTSLVDGKLSMRNALQTVNL